MKCPKCSYTSFDYLDNCRKCGTDLRDVRAVLQIITVSPEERAPVYAQEAAPSSVPADAYAAQVSSGIARGRDSAPEEANDELLADLNFDESFDEIVMPTSYASPPPQAKPAPTPEDEGLLDLDFGDMFTDDTKK